MLLATSDTFPHFGAAHGCVVLGFVLFATSLVLLRRQLEPIGRSRALDLLLASIAVVLWLTVNGWWFLPANFDRASSWPLHVCDLAGIAAPIVLVHPVRWLRAILYYWGLGLSTQSFITPAITASPRDPGFWFFWATHYIVVGISIYDLAARGYRPGWRDFRIGAIAGLIYVALLVPIDVIFGVNYGYLGPNQLEHPTLIDWLGPWPWRIAVMYVLGLLLTALMTLPWEIARKSE
jgi:hypothetical integral membrane protein (TIGR02206 family)